MLKLAIAVMAVAMMVFAPGATGWGGRELAGGGVALAAPAGQESVEYYEALWQEALAELNAATTCDEAVAAFTKLATVDRERQLIGQYTGESTNPLTYAPLVQRICYDEFFTKCKERLDPAYGVGMRHLLRDAAVIGNETLDATKVDRCLTFELRFDSRFVMQDQGFTTTSQYRASIPVASNGDGLGTFSGQAALDGVDFTVQVPPPASTRDARGESGELGVTRLISDFPYVAGTLTRGQALDLQIAVQIWKPTVEHWMVVLPAIPGVAFPPLAMSAPVWMGAFTGMHENEQLGDAGWLISEFQHEGGTIYARRRYERSGAVAGAPVEEQTTIELWHTPAP